MTHSARILPVYAADTSGVCSALYELGGMTVIHDASGCNSTYTTHDEPRWYDMDSMVYISGLTEMEAVLGDDDKLIDDIAEAVGVLSPRFVAVCGAPIPAMVGTDFQAIAAAVEARTGTPAFGLRTTGMRSYLAGVSEALEAVVENFCRGDASRTKGLSANVIGATPLDFSVNGSVTSIRRWLAGSGFEVVSCLAMGSGLDEIRRAGGARVNLVVSSGGMAAARALRRRFGTPYVAGVPMGAGFSARLAAELRGAAASGKSGIPCARRKSPARGGLSIVGESVSAGSLACALEAESGEPARVLCPLETERALLAEGDVLIPEEDDAAGEFAKAGGVVADPLYRPVCPAGVPFYGLPHEAFSGRCHRKSIPNLIGQNLERWRWMKI